MNPLPFTRADVDAANDAWGFNCGPGALCALLGKTPAQIRPDLCEFEDKRYTNPTLMKDILRGLGVAFRQSYRADVPPIPALHWLPKFGLVRVQWAGSWTRPGVPMRARYRHTHWIAARHAEPSENHEGHMIYDVNADSWMPSYQWKEELVPHLLREFAPDSGGAWWPTHTLEVDPSSIRHLPSPACS